MRRARRSSWSTGAGVIRLYGTLASMPASFSVEYRGPHGRGHPGPDLGAGPVRLLVDGETVAETKANGQADRAGRRRVRGPGGDAVLGRERQARVARPGRRRRRRVRARPRAGHARGATGRVRARHPQLYASRHVLSGRGSGRAGDHRPHLPAAAPARDPVAVDRSAATCCRASTCRTSRCHRSRSIIELPGWVKAVLGHQAVLAADRGRRRARLARARAPETPRRLGLRACSRSRRRTARRTPTRTSSTALRPCSCSGTAPAAASARRT